MFPGDWADKFARIECHYFVNRGFMREGQLLEKAEVQKIRHIPCTIVQGRYDSVCPATTAWQLHKCTHDRSRRKKFCVADVNCLLVWPEAKLVIVPDAGHNAKEPGIQKVLIAATDEYVALPC